MNCVRLQDHRVSRCRHSRLREALRVSTPQEQELDAEFEAAVSAFREYRANRRAPRGASSRTGLLRWASGALAVALVWFCFACFASVDYSAWEENLVEDEIAVCQTTADGRVRIVTVPNPEQG